MLDHLLRILFPGACLLCDTGLAPGLPEDLCDDCRPSLPWNQHPCPRCGLPESPVNPVTPAGSESADSANRICNDCTTRPPPFALTIAPLRYEGDVVTWVRRLKRNLGMVEGRLLGMLLAAHAEQAYDGRSRPDLLVPVPLTWQRLMARGHNQSITLARPLARRLGIPLWRTACYRTRHGTAQRKLGLEGRMANMQDMFAIRQPLSGQCVAIVDDVMTTGATLSALAQALLEAGAGEVHALCVARTPRARARSGRTQGGRTQSVRLS